MLPVDPDSLGRGVPERGFRGCSAARRRGPTVETAGGRFDTTDTVRQVSPGCSSPQDPQDAIEHRTVLPPRAPSTVFAAHRLWQEARNEVPLLVREVTGMDRSREAI